MPIAPDHPIQTLGFFVDGKTDEVIVEDLQRLIANLAQTDTWSISQPEYIAWQDDEPGKQDSDRERGVGGMLRLYSALPPWDRVLPKDVDRRQLSEAECVVSAPSKFSAKHALEIASEPDVVQIGWIEDGVVDPMLAVGFLGEWRRHLEQTV